MPRLAPVIAAVALTVVVGCTAADTAPTPTAQTSSTTSSTPLESSSTSSTSTTSTPVTQLGLVAGPGVDSTSITLGTLLDPSGDDGFVTGVELWRTSVNDAGGICSRTITLVGTDGGSPSETSRTFGPAALGFVVDTTRTDVAEGLDLSADAIPAIATNGSDADLLPDSPTVVGATDDILAINALDATVAAGRLTAGDTVGVVADASARALSGLQGLRWYAKRAGLSLLVQTATGRDVAALRQVSTVFALGEPALTAELVAGLPSATLVTTLAGYDQSLLTAAEAARVRVAMTTPAPGSTQPGTTAIESALSTTGHTAGPSTFAGYAAGATWGRLLAAACDAQQLTREGVAAARLTVGPASVESLIGASDPALPTSRQLPASRSSALAVADPSKPSGLAPLSGLVVAAGIQDYSPIR